MEVQTISRIACAAMFILAGIMHFIQPKFFLYIMPRWVPNPRLVNQIVGLLEILLGAALFFSPVAKFAAYSLIVLLIVVFPANIRHYQIAREKGKYVWITLLRLPVQFLLIYWAYSIAINA